MKKVKIFDRFEFPEILNMSNYIDNNNNNNYYNNNDNNGTLYKLSGVVVHVGSSTYR